MVEINFSQLFDDECSSKFHISRSSARDCLENPDRIEKTNLDEYVLVFAIKAFNDKFLLLVVASEKKDELRVDSAYKIRLDLEKGITLRNPAYILEKLINKFGLEVKVGDQTRRFILCQKIESA